MKNRSQWEKKKKLEFKGLLTFANFYFHFFYCMPNAHMYIPTIIHNIISHSKRDREAQGNKDSMRRRKKKRPLLCNKIKNVSRSFHFIQQHLLLMLLVIKIIKSRQAQKHQVEFVQKEERERDLISHDSDTFACLTMNIKKSSKSSSIWCRRKKKSLRVHATRYTFVCHTVVGYEELDVWGSCGAFSWHVIKYWTNDAQLKMNV